MSAVTATAPAVTVSRPEPYEPGSMRNGTHNARSGTVTDSRPEPYEPGAVPVTDGGPAENCAGEIRNSMQNRRSGTVTDSRPAEYSAGPLSVTCAKCGTQIPPGRPVIIPGGWHRTRPSYGGKSVCITCARADEYLWPWPLDGTPLVYLLSAGSPYNHTCARCGRWFYGTLRRRYCSDRCGELTRAGRRDRTAVREPRPCATCGEWFTPPRDDGRYCSPACRQRAYRKRRQTA